MITRRGGALFLRQGNASAASRSLENSGYAVLRAVFESPEVAALADELTRVFEKFPPDIRRSEDKSVPWEDFRYEILNRSAAGHKAVADRRILDVIEPLLGEDCHVIANTCWRNSPRKQDRRGGPWHVDAGPHVPRPPGIKWDDRIPYPIFAIGVHILLQDCPESCGPTAVIPGSHKSGAAPPIGSHANDLQWNGQRAFVLAGKAGDVIFFCSDVWHRRAPSANGDKGRFFLQVHYGRRDLAQRLRPAAQANQLAPAARKRAVTDRDKSLVGLHRPFFYDG